MRPSGSGKTVAPKKSRKEEYLERYEESKRGGQILFPAHRI